jgi:hypothetical protein
VYREIAARFGVDPGTVQRFTRPFGGAMASFLEIAAKFCGQ